MFGSHISRRVLLAHPAPAEQHLVVPVPFSQCPHVPSVPTSPHPPAAGGPGRETASFGSSFPRGEVFSSPPTWFKFKEESPRAHISPGLSVPNGHPEHGSYTAFPTPDALPPSRSLRSGFRDGTKRAPTGAERKGDRIAPPSAKGTRGQRRMLRPNRATAGSDMRSKQRGLSLRFPSQRFPGRGAKSRVEPL